MTPNGGSANKTQKEGQRILTRKLSILPDANGGLRIPRSGANLLCGFRVPGYLSQSFLN